MQFTWCDTYMWRTFVRYYVPLCMSSSNWPSLRVMSGQRHVLNIMCLICDLMRTYESRPTRIYEKKNMTYVCVYFPMRHNIFPNIATYADNTKNHINNVVKEIISVLVRSRKCGCLVTWFCDQLIAKPGNKTAKHSWPDPYWQISRHTIQNQSYIKTCLREPCLRGLFDYQILPLLLTNLG